MLNLDYFKKFELISSKERKFFKDISDEVSKSYTTYQQAKVPLPSIVKGVGVTIGLTALTLGGGYVLGNEAYQDSINKLLTKEKCAVEYVLPPEPHGRRHPEYINEDLNSEGLKRILEYRDEGYITDLKIIACK